MKKLVVGVHDDRPLHEPALEHGGDMEYQGTDRRASVLTKEDIILIADAVTDRAKTAFHIEEESHYNQHKKLDSMLEAYTSATNIFWKTFLALVIVGGIILAGLTATGKK